MQKENLKIYMETNMISKLVIICLITMVGFSSLEARYKAHVTKEKIGQNYYLNRCSSCHGEGNRGGNLYSIYEWKGIFSNKGKELIALHDGEDDVENTIIYIKSDSFKKESAKMLKFIQEFAYDSDTIPTCN